MDKNAIFARFDEAGRILFGGQIHTDRATLESAIEEHLANPKLGRSKLSVELGIVGEFQKALESAQGELGEARKALGQALAECDALRDERDALRAERDALQAEIMGLKNGGEPSGN